MNKHNLATINLFWDVRNIDELHRRLILAFHGHPKVKLFLHTNMVTLVSNFLKQVNKDFLYTKIVKKPDINDQLACLNGTFLKYTSEFISRDLLREDQAVRSSGRDMCTMSDGVSASSRGVVADADRLKLCDTNTTLVQRVPDGRTQTADQCLQAWRYPRRPVELRDDSVGTLNVPTANTTGGQCTTNYRPPTINWFDEGTEINDYGKERMTNESDTAYVASHDYDQLDRLLSMPKIQLLNGNNSTKSPYDPQSNVKLWADGNSFVDASDPEAMTRMMNKKTFRSYYGNGYSCPPSTCDGNYGNNVADDTACQIPWYERKLYNRYYERDVEENIGGFERTSHQSMAHDMSTLRCRVDKQKEINHRNYKFNGQTAKKTY